MSDDPKSFNPRKGDPVESPFMVGYTPHQDGTVSVIIQIDNIPDVEQAKAFIDALTDWMIKDTDGWKKKFQ